MTTKIYRNLWIGMVAVAALGCAASSNDSQFLVTKAQRSALSEVFDEVALAAAQVPAGDLSVAEVERILRTHDDAVAQILDAAQFEAYEAEHRSRFAKRVYRDLLRVDGPGTGIGRTAGMPSPTVNSY